MKPRAIPENSIPKESADAGLALLNHSPIPTLLMAGRDHIVRQANPAFGELMHLPPGNFLNRPISETLRDQRECLEALKRVRLTGNPENLHTPHFLKAPPHCLQYTLWKAGAEIVMQVKECEEPHPQMVAVNEALVLGSLRQHELTEAADTLNAELRIQIDERIRAETALRVSEEFARSVIASSPDCINTLDPSGVLLAFLRGAYELLGTEDVHHFLSRSWIDLWQGEDREAARAAVATAAAGGQGAFIGHFHPLQTEPKWWDVKISGIPDADGRIHQLLAVSRDVTAHKQQEIADALLADVSLDLVRSTNVGEMMGITSAKIGAHLDLRICAFFELKDGTAEELTLVHEWHREDSPDLAATYRLADFVNEEFVSTAKGGEVIVVCDTATDPRTLPARFAALQIASFICVPLLRDGEWRFALAVYHSSPRLWREDEIQLVRELTARIWTRLQQLRAEQALRESEERYRQLFNSIDEGFCVVEMIFNKRHRPVDYRFLEVNPSFEKETGLHDPVGKRIRELVPTLEKYWFETYGQVALTGEPVRFVHLAKSMDQRWFDFYAFRLGGNGSHKVAILFTNITSRKHTQDSLLASEALQMDIINSLPAHIAVLDKQGRITKVNEPWIRFAQQNGGLSEEKIGVGADYFAACRAASEAGDALARSTLAGLKSILSGRKNHFSIIYPCDLPDQSRWFSMEIFRLGKDNEGIIVSHTDITARILAEKAQGTLEAMTASNQKLKQEITSRQAVEEALRLTEQKQTLLLAESRQLQKQLRDTSHQILRVQEEERLRISRELHDVITQTLVGINVHVAALAHAEPGISSEFSQKITRTHRMVEKAIDTVHHFARELRPTVLDDLGLIPALHAYLKTFIEETGVRASLKISATIEKSSSEVLTVLFRVVQESLINVARHANANCVSVTIEIVKKTILLQVTDDGRGFDVDATTTATAHNRLGLLGMRERVEMLGGTFCIQSAPGQSTTVHVQLNTTGAPNSRRKKTSPNTSLEC